jgi:ribosomal protein S20
MKTIDRAAARGAMHKNTAARRKARVARLVTKSAA